MSHSTPCVSVIMSVYNGSHYLREAIDSILNQSFSDFEFIIINDCSTDDTEDILTGYARRDNRVVLLKNEENLGLTKSLNKGLVIARGDYIARQDADDISLPERLNKQIEILENYREVILVSCNLELVDADGKSIQRIYRDCLPEILQWHLLFYNHIGGHSQVVFRRRPVVELGGYSEHYRYAQDYELWLRLAGAGKFLILPDILLHYRYIHSESISAKFRAKQEEFALLAAKSSITSLIDQDVDLSEIANLKRFWELRFPEAQQAKAVHGLLSQIYNAFLEQIINQSPSKHQLSRQIRALIGERFTQWLQTLSAYQINELLIVSHYALMWNPKTVSNYYLNRVSSSARHHLLKRDLSFKL